MLNRALGRCDAAQPDVPRGAAQPPVTGSFRSAARRREVAFAISYPPGYAPGARLPVCLALHGYAADAGTAIAAARYRSSWPVRCATAWPRSRSPRRTAERYWHPHADDDPLGMLVDEFLPLLAVRGLRTDRVAVAGWSMGGYGALLAALTHRDRFRAVVATSPAVFHSYDDARAVNAGAFDSADEWARST